MEERFFITPERVKKIFRNDFIAQYGDRQNYQMDYEPSCVGDIVFGIKDGNLVAEWTDSEDKRLEHKKEFSVEELFGGLSSVLIYLSIDPEQEVWEKIADYLNKYFKDFVFTDELPF